MSKTVLILLFFTSLYSEDINDYVFNCNRADYQACSNAGSLYLSSYSKDHDLFRAESFLKKACDQGKIEKSCYNLWNYYTRKSDKENAKYYAQKSCDLGNGFMCSIANYKK